MGISPSSVCSRSPCVSACICVLFTAATRAGGGGGGVVAGGGGLCRHPVYLLLTLCHSSIARVETSHPPWPCYPTCSSSPPAALPPLPFAGWNVGGLKVLECSAKVPSTLEMARGSGGSRCGGIPEGRGHGGGLLGGGSARARARLWVPSPFGSPMLNLPPNIPFPLSQLTLPRAELLWVPSGRDAEL